ncbi:MAG: NOB1 family endonuclease [Promethearchaeota archaeon]
MKKMNDLKEKKQMDFIITEQNELLDIDFDFKIPTYVFDATPLISGINLGLFDGNCVTTSKIFEEVKFKMARKKMDIFLELGLIKVIDPPTEYINQAKKLAEWTGDLNTLSIGDLSIIALSLYLSFIYNNLKIKERGDESGAIMPDKTKINDFPIYVITDDYALQNVLLSCNIKFRGFKRKKINELKKWKGYCISCKKEFHSSMIGKKCPACGLKIKKREKK